MLLKLVIKKGKYQGEILTIEKFPAYFGREEGDYSATNLGVSELGISWEHFAIYQKDEFFFLKDLRSTNGTFLNEKRLSSPLKLKENDVIQAGGMLLQVIFLSKKTNQTPVKITQMQPQEVFTDAMEKQLKINKASLTQHSFDLEDIILESTILKNVLQAWQKEQKDIIAEIVDVLLEQFHAHRGAMIFKNTSERSRYRKDKKRYAFAIDSFVTEEVLKNNTSIICEGSQGSLPLLSAPLVSRGETIGLIYLDHPFVSPLFTLEDLQTLTFVGAMIGDYIEKTLGFAKLEEDNAQKEKLLAQMEIAYQAAMDASQIKSGFVANMSHELRTPLNAIIGHISLTLKSTKNQLSQKDLGRLSKADKAARSLLLIINDILDFSKIEAGQVELRIEKIRAHEIVEDVAFTVEGMLIDKPVEVKLEIEENLPSIESDYTKIKQIITNLLGNAAKFTKEGHILARVKLLDKSLCIEIEDTGCGVAKEQLPHIFETFRQANNSIRKSFGGSGLGLAITKEFCDVLGIKIDISSEEGKGTVFKLTCPIKFTTPEDIEKIHVTKKTKFTRRVSQVMKVKETVSLDSDTLLLLGNPTNTASLLFLGDPFTYETFEKRFSSFLLKTEHVKSVAHCLHKASSSLIWAVVVDPHSDLEAMTVFTEHPLLLDIPVILCMANAEIYLSAIDHAPNKREEQRLLNMIKRMSTSKGDVLVVENHSHWQKLYERLLQENGYNLHIAKTSSEALGILDSITPRAIILDLLMPEMDGFQFLEIFEQQPKWKSIPILAMTGKELSQPQRDIILQQGTHMLLEREGGADRCIEAIMNAIHFSSARSVLVVDDNHANLGLTSEIFESENYKVLKALSGKEAIDIAKKESPEVALMDLAMSEMDGFQTTKELKKLQETLIVIACSAFSTTEFKEKSFRAGCEGYISKPIDPEKLVSQVREIALISKIRRKLNDKNSLNR